MKAIIDKNCKEALVNKKVKNPMKFYRDISYSSLARLSELNYDIIVSNFLQLLVRILKGEAFMSPSSLNKVAERFSKRSVILKVIN